MEDVKAQQIVHDSTFVDFESGDYNTEACVLANCLIHPDGFSSHAERESFVLAICGPWGSGKTRFANQILRVVENGHWTTKIDGEPYEFPQAPVIRFEPWAFEDSVTLVSNFLLQLGECVEELRDACCENGVEASGDIEETANRIDATLVDNFCTLVNGFNVLVTAMSVVSGFGTGASVLGVAKGINKILKSSQAVIKDTSLTGGEESEAGVSGLAVSSFEARKKELSDCLDKLGLRIVVCIDNIDRLRQEQMRLVFALVAAIADFPALSYILVFDEDVVCRALGSVHGETGDMAHGHAFLEKVVSLWYPLPNLRVGELADKLLDGLVEDSVLPSIPFFDAVPDEGLRRALLRYLLRTPRIALRLCENLRVWTTLGRSPRIPGQVGNESLFVECYLSIWHPMFYRESCDVDAHAWTYIGEIGKDFELFLRRSEGDAVQEPNDKGERAAAWLARMSGARFSEDDRRVLQMLHSTLSDVTSGGGNRLAEQGRARFVELAICCYLLTKLSVRVDSRGTGVSVAHGAKDGVVRVSEQENVVKASYREEEKVVK